MASLLIHVHGYLCRVVVQLFGHITYSAIALRFIPLVFELLHPQAHAQLVPRRPGENNAELTVIATWISSPTCYDCWN